MLLHLEISNIALIDRIAIEPRKGLNVLSGETGAGKSIIIDSINALLGQRVFREIIRTGSESALVEGLFTADNPELEKVLEQYGLQPEEDGTVLLSREIWDNGKNICRINGKMITVTALRDIGQYLVDIHGQHDSQSLLVTKNHAVLLDEFAGKAMTELVKTYNDLASGCKNALAKLESIIGQGQDRERKIDLLRFQIDEITAANLVEDEEEELKKQKLIMVNAEKIISGLSRSYEVLSGGSEAISVLDGLNEALSEIAAVSSWKEEYASLVERMEGIIFDIEDIARELREESETVEFEPSALEMMEERLDLIHTLKRKYGRSIKEVMDFAKKTQEQLDELINSEELVEELKVRIENYYNGIIEKSRLITNERKKAALLLEQKIGIELDDLNMKNTRFCVSIKTLEEDEIRNGRLPSDGADQIEFLFSPNPGEPLKPLSRIASGGEMSRVMLAIKKILADVDRIPTLIFDEIDIGISGSAAQKVGEKLSYISRRHQVICVTHLAQIACMADTGFKIEKISNENSTVTRVSKLEGEDRIREIARIIDGSSYSEISFKHAGEMLQKAENFKKSQIS